MGSRFSSSNSSTTAAAAEAPTVKVVAVDGSLREYSAAVSVARVLGPHHPSCFLCSADSLFYDAFIPAMGPGALLQLGQLYFVLPAVMLESPLAGKVMVALAVKASSALGAASAKHGRRRRFRVMPVSEVSGGVDEGEVVRSDEKSNGVFRPAVSVHRKARRIASWSSRVGSARSRLSRERLSTIEEAVE